MVQINPQVIAAQGGPWAQVRTGTVVSGTADNLVILVGGTSFRAQAIESYNPVPGDLVPVIRQDATWLVLGRLPGSGPNEVCNFSFETGAVNVAPPLWTLYNITGNSSVTTVPRGGAPGGGQVARVVPLAAGTSESYLYSCPIEVSPGQRWDLSAYVGALYTDGVSPDADADLVALWFANDTNLYPTTSSADTTVASLDDVTALPPFTGISGTVTVPTGTSVMRVALRSSLVADQALEWDFVTARLVTEGQTSPQGLGLIDFTAITSDTAPTVGTLTAFSTPALTFQPGRAYRIAMRFYAQSSVSGDTVRVRGVIGATAVIDSFGAVRINSTAGNSSAYFETIVRVTGTAPVVSDIDMTYARNTGTGNVFIGASATLPAYIEVQDIGPADRYPGATAL